MIVVDASVALKWFFAETESEAARLLLEAHAGQMAMPELFLTEVLATFIREATIDAERANTMRANSTDFLAMRRRSIFAVQPAVTVMARATDIALQLRHPFKDCLYLAFAERLNCHLVTADLRFTAKAREIYPAVAVLGEAIE